MLDIDNIPRKELEAEIARRDAAECAAKAKALTPAQAQTHHRLTESVAALRDILRNNRYAAPNATTLHNAEFWFSQAYCAFDELEREFARLFGLHRPEFSNLSEVSGERFRCHLQVVRDRLENEEASMHTAAARDAFNREHRNDVARDERGL